MTQRGLSNSMQNCGLQAERAPVIQAYDCVCGIHKSLLQVSSQVYDCYVPLVTEDSPGREAKYHFAQKSSYFETLARSVVNFQGGAADSGGRLKEPWAAM